MTRKSLLERLGTYRYRISVDTVLPSFFRFTGSAVANKYPIPTTFRFAFPHRPAFHRGCYDYSFLRSSWITKNGISQIRNTVLPSTDTHSTLPSSRIVTSTPTFAPQMSKNLSWEITVCDSTTTPVPSTVSSPHATGNTELYMHKCVEPVPSYAKISQPTDHVVPTGTESSVSADL